MTDRNDLQPVLVKWVDAHAYEGGSWVYPHDIEDTGDYLVHSIGWALPPGEGGFENHVSIAQSHGDDNAIDHIINIPMVMVRSVTYLTELSKEIQI